jgi:tetratricopeptide (TPR) repeat protein
MNKKVKATAALLLLSLMLLSLFLLTRYEKQKYPVLGTNMIEHVGVFEDHRDALAHWIKKGIRNAVLVNIDAHDDLKRVPPEQMEMVKAAYQQREGDYRDAEVALGGYAAVSNSNFIHAAAKLGIIKKVLWVVPATYDLFSDPGNRLAALLKMYGFRDEDIKTFRIKNGCFIGATDGIPLTICDIRSLPDVSEPVLLSVDVDYFPAMVNDNDSRITDSVKQTFNALFNKGYAIRDAIVAYSVNGGFMDPCYRWVGDLVIDNLRIPGLVSQAGLPDRYFLLQRADLLLMMKRYGELLDDLSPFLHDAVAEPAILSYAAKACQGLGETEKSFHYAEKACLSDNRYCYCLPELGTIVLDEKGVDAAERFFVRGYDLCPDMDYGQFRFAMALKEFGRHDDAIKYFKDFRNCYGSFPVDLYIAETFLRKGDERSAMRYYDSCRTELAKNPAVLAGFGDFNKIENAAVFYDRRGYARYASLLRDSIKFKDNEASYCMDPPTR